MLKDSSNQDRYNLLKDWIQDILLSIRKDLRQDHLKKDVAFLKQHFGGRSPNKLNINELYEVYQPYIQAGDERIWEFITTRWLLKYSEIYDFFESELYKINPQFSEIEELSLENTKSIMDRSIALYGAKNTYIFSVLNSVVFPKEAYQQLNEYALEERQKQSALQATRPQIKK